MDEVVRRMHTTSGLLTAIGESTLTVDEAGCRHPRVRQVARSRRRARCRCAGTRSRWIAVSCGSTCRRSTSTSITARSTSPR